MAIGYRLIKYAGAVLVGACVVAMAPVAGQTPPQVPMQAPATGDGSGSAGSHEGMVIGGNPPSSSSLERCVDVQIGGDNAYSCLNQKLKREVDRTNPSVAPPTLNARSPDVAVGNVNEAAVREQYGSNYGRSAVPYRPPVQTFVPPHR